MFLQRLSISNFKNCREADLEFSSRLNCFIGNNGAGKTNILDAIYYLSFCKSYFNTIDAQNICHGERFFSIKGLYARNGAIPDEVHCLQQTDQRKQFRINKKEYDRLADHIGLLPLVMISPYDRDLINEGSDIRRKYLDSVISQFDKTYLNHLIRYNKALIQRNNLLRQHHPGSPPDQSLLDILDLKLIEPGAYIFAQREAFVRKFVPIFQHYFRFISQDEEQVSLVYESQLQQSTLQELLSKSYHRDIQTQYSTTGIHKDDLQFLMNGFPVKKFGSQGQQKSFVTAIRLAQFDYIRTIRNIKPILLLDDIFDKLDDHRVARLIRLVSEENFGQVFITDTQLERVLAIFSNHPIDHRIFHIDRGSLTVNGVNEAKKSDLP